MIDTRKYLRDKWRWQGKCYWLLHTGGDPCFSDSLKAVFEHVDINVHFAIKYCWGFSKFQKCLPLLKILLIMLEVFLILLLIMLLTCLHAFKNLPMRWTQNPKSCLLKLLGSCPNLFLPTHLPFISFILMFSLPAPTPLTWQVEILPIMHGPIHAFFITGFPLRSPWCMIS